MRKILASILAVVLCATMAASIFAVEPPKTVSPYTYGSVYENKTLQKPEVPEAAEESPAAEEAPAEDATAVQGTSDGIIAITVPEDAEGILDLTDILVGPGDILVLDKDVEGIELGLNEAGAAAGKGLVAVADDVVLKTFYGSIIIYDVPAGVEIAIVDNAAEFTDVEADAYYADALDFATARGYLYGNGDGTFAPDADMTDAALYATIIRVFNGDSYTGEGWEEAVKAAAYDLGFSIDEVEGAITRGEAIAILSNVIGEDAVEAGIFVGDENGELNEEEVLTRAQLAVIAERLDIYSFN